MLLIHACARPSRADTQSRYRHVYGQPSKVSYENAKISGSAWDTNLVTVGGVSKQWTAVDGHGLGPHRPRGLDVVPARVLVCSALLELR